MHEWTGYSRAEFFSNDVNWGRANTHGNQQATGVERENQEQFL